MEFEYDLQKSRENKVKHGIDFEEAKAVWNDQGAIQLDTMFEAEERFLAIGSIDGVLWTVVITYRGDNVRIISARRAREKEVASYDNR